jgi:S-adenosylmethionine synthetase
MFTSESVSEGHPDKVCDYIADSILDAYLASDPHARVACEVLCKSSLVVIAGEITSRAEVDREAVARRAIEEIGYTDRRECFNAADVKVLQSVTQQSPDIQRGVDAQTAADHEQGAGDQGIMFGYATDETAELLPLPIVLAHRLTRGLAEDRRSGKYPWLRPDSKAQVTVRYQLGRPQAVERVLVSTQHSRDIDQPAIRAYVIDDLAPRALDAWHFHDIRFDVNPTGSFVKGGPAADAGVTGRKIIVDTYGGAGKHGGGAFSGKDPSKVDRSGAYFCRHVARRIVREGIARRAEIQVAYAIGLARPVSIRVDTFNSGNTRAAEEFVERQFDFRPAAMIERLSLLRPIYRQTTNYGHFGKPELPWES